MKERLLAVLRNEQGQTIIEWTVLSIMVAMTMVVVGMAFANSLPPLFEALYERIVELANSIGI